MSFWRRIKQRFSGGGEARAGLANPPAWLYDSLAGGVTSSSGVSVSEESALAYATVYACVRILADTVGTTPLHLYRRLDGGGKERATEHPLYHLFAVGPNPEMTAFRFKQLLQGHLATWGNAYAEIVFDGRGRVMELWPLRPDRMRVERRGGRLVYTYTRLSGGEVELRPGTVLHIPGFGFDGVVGYSPIRLAREAIGLGLAAQEYGARLFANNARPSGVLEYPGKLAPEAVDQLRKAWESAHGGLARAHRPAILEGGLTWKSISIPPDDAQFLETRKFQRSEICGFYRIPPHMVGDLERATFSNIEHQGIEFLTLTMAPWFVLWEQEITRALLRPEEQGTYFFEFLVAGLLRGDIQSRYQAYAVGRQNGWLSANDIRELENMNPIEGGDVYLVPLNMVPASEVSAVSAEGGDGDSGDRVESRSRGARSVRLRNRLARRHFGIFRDAAGRIVRREVIAVKRAIKRYLGQRDEVALETWLDGFYRDLPDYIRRQMFPVLRTYADAVAEAAAGEVGAEPGVTPELERFVEEYLGAYSARHVKSSLGQLRQLLRDTSPEEAAAALETRLDEWDERRPDKVAANETVRAGAAVAKVVWASAGITMIRWVAQGAKSCPYCQEMDGKVVGIEQNFVAEGENYEPEGADGSMVITGPISHPPLHQGCECTIAPG